jgi:hypothetical protein
VDGNQVVSQRFAVDWMRLDQQHRAWVGDPARLSNYLSYGQPLIAAAAGKVVEARDGFADQPALTPRGSHTHRPPTSRSEPTRGAATQRAAPSALRLSRSRSGSRPLRDEKPVQWAPDQLARRSCFVNEQRWFVGADVVEKQRRGW